MVTLQKQPKKIQNPHIFRNPRVSINSVTNLANSTVRRTKLPRYLGEVALEAIKSSTMPASIKKEGQCQRQLEAKEGQRLFQELLAEGENRAQTRRGTGRPLLGDRNKCKKDSEDMQEDEGCI